MNATYLYCLVKSEKKPSLARVPAGLADANKPRLIEAGSSLWLVAADAPISRYGEEALEAGLKDLDWVTKCAMAHEAVVDHFMHDGRQAVVPMKLFTLFRTDQRALEHIASMRKGLNSALKRIEGCREWGVRMRVNQAKAAAAARAESQSSPTGSGQGTRFLLLKKREKDFTRNLATRSAEDAASAFQELSRHAADARRLPIATSESGGRVVLDAAFLVPKEKEQSFRDAVAKVTRQVAGTNDVTLSGPWPAYNFV